MQVTPNASSLPITSFQPDAVPSEQERKLQDVSIQTLQAPTDSPPDHLEERKINLLDLPPEILQNIHSFLGPSLPLSLVCQSLQDMNKNSPFSATILSNALEKYIALKNSADRELYQNKIRALTKNQHLLVSDEIVEKIVVTIDSLKETDKTIVNWVLKWLKLQELHNLSENSVEKLARLATRFGNTTILAKLLEHPKVDHTTICLASCTDHADIIRFLLAHAKVDSSIWNNFFLPKAIETQKADIVSLLLNDKRVDPTSQTNSVLKWAYENNYPDIVKLLLNDKRVDSSSHTNSVLNWAYQNNHPDIVRLLLADNRVDPRDHVALIWAIQNGHKDIVSSLLADPRIDPVSTIHKIFGSACRSGQADIVRFLLADPRLSPSFNDLMVSVKQGYIKVVGLILASQRVHLTERQYETAFRWAFDKGYTDIVRFILTDPKFDSVIVLDEIFTMACAKSRVDIIRLLLADPRVSPSIEILIGAIKNGHFEVLSLLLNDVKVINLLINDHDGFECVLEEASRRNFTDVVDALYRIKDAYLADSRDSPSIETLIGAIKNGNIDNVHRLLADLTVIKLLIEDNNEFTRTLEEAMSHNLYDVVEALYHIKDLYGASD